jgi:hypothetical protein
MQGRPPKTYSLVVGLNDISLDDLASTHTAVVGALGGGEASSGPAVGAVVQVEEGVLLLQTEPGVALGVALHELGALQLPVSYRVAQPTRCVGAKQPTSCL